MGIRSSIAPALNAEFERQEEDLKQMTQLCNLTVELCKHPLHKATSPIRSPPNPRMMTTPPDSAHGAEVSFFKPYNTLRDTNVGSTKEIIRLSLEHNHVTHIQFVSTSGLATVLSCDLFEGPVCSSPPEFSGPQGYILTRLACELYLENVSKTTGLYVKIHRPTVIVGPDAPRHDVMRSVLHYSENISAVPQLTGIEGTLQFVEVDRVAEDIMVDVTRDSTHGSHVEYRNQYDVNIEIHELGTFVGKRSGILISAVPTSEWVQKAEAAGMATEVAKFLGAVHLRQSEKSEKLALRRLWKGPPQ